MHPRAEQVDDSQDLGRIFGKWKVIGTGFGIKGKGGGSAYVCVCTGCNAKYQRITKSRLYHRNTKGCMSCVKPRGVRSYQWTGSKDIPGSLFYQIKRGAISRAIPFEIDVNDLQEQWDKQGAKCALSGEPLFVAARDDRNASLDRIDSSAPYRRGNIQWVSKDVNIMKNAITEARFVEMCGKVFLHKTGIHG